jgi:hypothetical protein
VPHHLILDRVYVHGHPTLNVSRCVAFNSAWSAVIDSYLAECHAQGFDSQVVGGWNGPGPFKIVNNYLEGAGENVMFGGADPWIAQLVPSDIEVRRNHFYKPLSWKGVWTIKNHFELKNGRRVLLEANVLENCWASGQGGNVILTQALTDNNTAAWVTVQDITIRNNWITNAPQGITIASRVAYAGSGRPALMPSQPSQRFAITNNVFDKIGSDPSLGDPFQLIALYGDLQNVTVAHNSGMTHYFTLALDGTPEAGLIVRDNVFARGRYGVGGTGTGEGTATLTTYAPGARFEGNVIFGNGYGGATASAYPANNSFTSTPDGVGFVNYSAGDYTLSPSSSFRGRATDGTDPGANMATLRAAITGVKQ